MKLIPEWRQAHRMYVVQVLGAIAAVHTTWAALKSEVPEFVAALPPDLVHWITVGLAVAGVVVRVVKQFDTPPAEPAQPEDPR